MYNVDGGVCIIAA